MHQYLELQPYFEMFQQLNPFVQIVVVGGALLFAGYTVVRFAELINDLVSTIFISVFGFLKVFFRGPEEKAQEEKEVLSNRMNLIDLEDESYDTLWALGAADRAIGNGPRLDFYGDKEAYLAGWHGKKEENEQVTLD